LTRPDAAGKCRPTTNLLLNHTIVRGIPRFLRYRIVHAYNLGMEAPVQAQHFERNSDERRDSCEHISPAATSEALRSASSQTSARQAGKGGDERISIFWRVFGGTILSIAALGAITVYQTQVNAIHDLRIDLNKLSEARAELVRKDDYSSSKSKIWDKFQDVQKDLQQLDPVKTRLGQLDEQNRALMAESKSTYELHASIKERLAQAEQQINGGKMMQKDIQAVQQMVSALQEKSVLRDQQMKQADDERKELAKEVQSLRERLAKVEARKESSATDGSK